MMPNVGIELTDVWPLAPILVCIVYHVASFRWIINQDENLTKYLKPDGVSCTGDPNSL